MPKCQFCGEEIGYLPFKCNYCGFTYCKQHRLPENHECSFDLKHKPVVPTDIKAPYRNKGTLYQNSQDHVHGGEKQLKKYLKRQEKERKKAQKTYSGYSQSTRGKGNATIFIILMIILFSIIEFSRGELEYYIIVNEITGIPIISSSLLGLYLWRAFTAPFVYFIGTPISFFLLFIMVYFLWYMGRIIELQRGSIFFVKFYLLCAVFKILIYALLDLPFAFSNPNENSIAVLLPSSCANAAIIGIMTLSILPLLNQQVTGLVGYMPMRMSGRTFLLIIVLLILGPALFLFLYLGDPYVFVGYLPDLGGLIAAYLVIHGKIKL